MGPVLLSRPADMMIRAICLLALVLAACETRVVFPPTSVRELEDRVGLDLAVARSTTCIRTSARDITCAGWGSGLSASVEAPAPIAMMTLWDRTLLCFTDVEHRAYCLSGEEGFFFSEGELTLLSDDAVEASGGFVRGSAGDVRFGLPLGHPPFVEAGATDISHASGFPAGRSIELCAVLSGEVRCSASPLEDPGTTVPGLRDVEQVEVGEDHACARRVDGTIACWGANDEGQLGTSPSGPRERPEEVAGIDDAIDLALRPGRSCALRSAGTVWCWGHLSLPEIERTPSPHRVHGVEDVIALDGDCALTRAGEVLCWGERRIVRSW